MKLSEIASAIEKQGFSVERVPSIAQSVKMLSVEVGAWFYMISGLMLERSTGEDFDYLQFMISFDEHDDFNLDVLNRFNKTLFMKG